MSNWEREIRMLAQGFNVPKETYTRIIESVKESTIAIPRFYKGDKDACMYDRAQRQLKAYM